MGCAPVPRTRRVRFPETRGLRGERRHLPAAFRRSRRNVHLGERRPPVLGAVPGRARSRLNRVRCGFAAAGTPPAGRHPVSRAPSGRGASPGAAPRGTPAPHGTSPCNGVRREARRVLFHDRGRPPHVMSGPKRPPPSRKMEDRAGSAQRSGCASVQCGARPAPHTRGTVRMSAARCQAAPRAHVATARRRAPLSPARGLRRTREARRPKGDWRPRRWGAA